jgi:hypothetical protein
MANSSFTRTDLIVVAATLLFLSCLLFPALAQSNSHADESMCLNKLKALALAILNHHDTRLSMPLASTQPIDHKPGSVDASNAAGYSWLAQLSPFLEGQNKFGSEVVKGMRDKAAFAPESSTTEQGKTVHLATVVLKEFICPSFKGDAHVSASDSEYQPSADGALPAISNYNAFVGTHFFNADGLGRLVPPEKLVPPASFAYEGNGAMPFPGINGGKLQARGLGFQSFSDGTSNTIEIAETIEPAESAWYDGQTAWLVAAWPGNDKIPTMQPSPNPNQPILCWSDDDKKTSKVAVNLRSADGTPTTYLAAGRWSGSKERRYAASSNHPGVVSHAFVDGHVEMIATDIDPNLYIQLVTRSGRELIAADFKKQQSKSGIPTQSSADEEGESRKPRGLPSGIEFVPEQWSPAVEWSPLSIGDLRLRFPELLASTEFLPDPGNPSLRTYRGKSSVFSTIVFDPKEIEYHFLVADQEATKAMPKLYKQLSAALGQPTKKEVDQRPKRITWKKDAKIFARASTFEFVLTEASDKDAANIVIHMILQ